MQPVRMDAAISLLLVRGTSTADVAVVQCPALRRLAVAQARDAVAKALYSRLFNHVVRCINRSLGGPGPAISSSPRARKAEAFAEEEEATAAAQEAVEAEVEAEAVAEAEGSAGPSHGSAGSDYW